MKHIKDIIYFILFLAYIIIIFFIRDYLILSCMALFNIILINILGIRVKQVILNLLHILTLIVLTVMLNAIIIDTAEGILIGVRLILVCNITYIFSKILSPLEIAIVIEKLLTPLKLFKVNTRSIGVMICIAISFIPILLEEIRNIRFSLKSKGFETNIKNTILHANFILNPLFISILNKIGEIEESLKSKGHIE